MPEHFVSRGFIGKRHGGDKANRLQPGQSPGLRLHALETELPARRRGVFSFGAQVSRKQNDQIRPGWGAAATWP
jgi:hypothetical protein